MKTLEEKCELLSDEYKDVDKDALIQLLLVCGESLVKTRALLDESFERSASSSRLAKYQSSITSMLGPKKKKLKVQQPTSNVSDRTKVITIYDEAQVDELLAPYVSLHRNFLPQKLSNNVLTHIMDNSHMYKPQEFYLFEKLCKSNHSLGFLYFPENFDQDTAYYNGQKGKIFAFNEDLVETAKLINNYINDKVIPNYEKLPFQQSEFHASACVINYYSKLSNNLDWHSDRLQAMGPHNFVASVSLGSTREFRLRRHSEPRIIYSIHLPHNALLLMHPGCQELFKHCVNPMKKSLQLHPICGLSRFNLTFRYFPRDFTDSSPKCKCDIPMCLRRAYKDPTSSNFGRYHWTCENIYRNKDCKTFHWADFNNPENHFISETEETISTWTVK